MSKSNHVSISTVLLAMAFALAPRTSIQADVPGAINFQGILKDGSGNPVANGSYSVAFTMYDAPTGGTTLWSETQSVTTTSGLFTVLLGSSTPIPDTLFNDSSRYLGIKVGADPEMMPRQRMASVGYSYVSDQWSSVDSTIFRLKGFVGIGTSTPGGKLDVATTTGNAAIVAASYALGGNGVVAYGDARAVLATSSPGGTAVDARSGYLGVKASADGMSASPILGVSALGENHSTGESFGGQFFGDSHLAGTAYGVHASGYSGNGTAYGGYFVVDSFSGGTGYGIYSSGKTYGAFSHGGTNGVVGEGGTNGVYGSSLSGIGVRGFGTTYGVYGQSGGGIAAVYGDISGNFGTYGGYFQGDVRIERNLVVVGTVFKGGLAFQMDHPLDPANQYLNHSGVESPDMKNIYDGVITTDGQGNADVVLPDWFEALNRDFRYQLTVIGEFAQAIVSKKMSRHQFSIKTDKPNVEVSWQVTGIRQDVYANAHRIQVEEMKPENERGYYMHPKELGLPEELGIDFQRTRRAQAELPASGTGEAK